MHKNIYLKKWAADKNFMYHATNLRPKSSTYYIWRHFRICRKLLYKLFCNKAYSIQMSLYVCGIQSSRSGLNWRNFNAGFCPNLQFLPFKLPDLVFIQSVTGLHLHICPTLWCTEWTNTHLWMWVIDCSILRINKNRSYVVFYVANAHTLLQPKFFF